MSKIDATALARPRPSCPEKGIEDSLGYSAGGARSHRAVGDATEPWEKLRDVEDSGDSACWSQGGGAVHQPQTRLSRALLRIDRCQSLLRVISAESVDIQFPIDYINNMAKVRERRTHEQILLFRNGGKRRGAGRKPAGLRAGTSHASRPIIDGTNAMHVTLRVALEVGQLRRREIYRAIRAASTVTARREEFRIVHLSIQHDHVHMIVEAENKKALARGMQGFQISAAKQINKALGGAQPRRGRVFSDRYHLVVIGSPTQMRHVLAYVLCNWRKHRDDRRAPGWLVDPYATGFAFSGWRELAAGETMWPAGTYDWIVVRQPRSWVLRDGWRRGGAPISAFEVPGGHDE